MSAPSNQAILVGGPQDEEVTTTDGAALLELEINGLIHRYIRTTQQRERDGRQVTVYNYDGVIEPQPGTEMG